MTLSKEKDRILAEIKAFKPHNEIVGLSKHLCDLERAGHVKVWRNEQSRPITVRLKPQGDAFLESGGYSSVKLKSKFPATWHKTLRKDLWRLVLAILAAVIATYLSKRLGWM